MPSWPVASSLASRQGERWGGSPSGPVDTMRTRLGIPTALSSVLGQGFPHTCPRVLSLGPLPSLGQEWGRPGGRLSLGFRCWVCGSAALDPPLGAAALGYGANALSLLAQTLLLEIESYVILMKTHVHTKPLYANVHCSIIHLEKQGDDLSARRLAWSHHTVEYYSGSQRNEGPTLWMNLENVTLSDQSRIQNPCMISLL